jgi:hypothetical protein
MNANMVIVLRWSRSGFADTSRLPPPAARANRGQPRFNPEIHPARIRVIPGPAGPVLRPSADPGCLRRPAVSWRRGRMGPSGLLGFVVLDGVAHVRENVGIETVEPLAVVPPHDDGAYDEPEERA